MNGITNDGGENLFVTDFGANEIYRINANTESFNVMVANTVSTPNGIWYDGFNNRLIYVNWGTNSAIKAVSLADSSVSTIMSTTMAIVMGSHTMVQVHTISPLGVHKMCSLLIIYLVIEHPLSQDFQTLLTYTIIRQTIHWLFKRR